MQLLFEAGADINFKNKQGETALSLAKKIYGEKEEVPQWLITHGAKE